MNKHTFIGFIRIGILLACYITFTLVLACKNASELKDGSRSNIAYAQTKEQSSPCKEGQQLTLSKEELSKNYKLENYGYPSEISLEEAVESFNKQTSCEPNPRIIPLSADEVIAAIRYVSPNIERPPSWAKEQLEKIATERKMPKGSLLKGENGYKQPDGYNLDYWFIDLYLGLDKYPRFEAMKPGYYRIMIRRQFISATPNSKNK